MARILQNAKYTGSDDYAPIVDDELYDRAVALKTARQRNTFEKNREGIDLLRSCTRCAACGAPMHRRVNAKLRIRESWECTNPECGIRVRISDAHLLEIIVSLMNRLIENDTLLLPKKKRRITSDQARAISQEVMERLAQGPVDESYIIERAKEYARQLYDDGDTTTALSVAYDYGDRLEYDFGEVLLNCGEGMRTYHMAVLSSPCSDFRWLYLYTNQKKDVFLDSHVKFFEMVGGCYREVVYDNMKNVVSKFIGKNEKELNADLIKMAMYYGYQINVTNCFRGNEKGHVENSVKVLRNQLFSRHYTFGSLAEAQTYAHSRLLKLNEGCAIEREKACLLPYKPPLELAAISENTVDTYSMVHVDAARYSVPEHLVGHKVTVKKYHDEVRIYAAGEHVCTHKRIFGNGHMQVDIYHYLNTLYKKPGAVRNSVALKSIPRLKAIFDTHYAKRPRRFIELMLQNKSLSIDELIQLFEQKTKRRAEIIALDVVKPLSSVDVAARATVSNYSILVNGGVG